MTVPAMTNEKPRIETGAARDVGTGKVGGSRGRDELELVHSAIEFSQSSRSGERGGWKGTFAFALEDAEERNCESYSTTHGHTAVVSTRQNEDEGVAERERDGPGS